MVVIVIVVQMEYLVLGNPFSGREEVVVSRVGFLISKCRNKTKIMNTNQKAERNSNQAERDNLF
jgi:hypothetical protein